jgi:chemotaxis protein MotB
LTRRQRYPYAVHALLLITPLLTGCIAMQADQALVNKLDREVIALQQQARYMEQAAEDCSDREAPPDELYLELHQVFSYMGIEVTREGRAAVLTLPGNELFAPGSVRIRDEAEKYLDLLATALELHPEYRVHVEGHTDDTPITGRLAKTFPTNWELSSARAAAVSVHLAKEYSLSASRFTVAGRAHYSPLADNSTAEGRALNLRVIFTITPPEPRRL